ncbi:Uncharacterized protein APZ42_015824 [Daphnia magna]|uniref:Uncharacterized protein n=1 Tax=Daphnia magna TaxID=35525 RepID=A0A162NAT5_9CRUS|nr:Uncharacterized protein APZ42_015824 [Daphnia magna]
MSLLPGAIWNLSIPDIQPELLTTTPVYNDYYYYAITVGLLLKITSVWFEVGFF